MNRSDNISISKTVLPRETSKFSIKNDWLKSFCIHLAILLPVLGGFFIDYKTPPKENVEIEVYEFPKAQQTEIKPPKPLVEQKKAIEVDKPRQVFGVSRKALTDSTGSASVEVKAGNTVAKAEDDLKLRSDDADSLPIPTDEYLVSDLPRLKREVRIPYPADARQKGIEGPVIMDLLIDQQGKVRQVTLVSGPGAGLNEAATKAIGGFEFSPAKVDGQPVAVRIRYTYRFSLND